VRVTGRQLIEYLNIAMRSGRAAGFPGGATMNLKLLFNEAMQRHGRVLNRVAADIAEQIAEDTELRRQAAAMLALTLFAAEAEETDGLAEALYANMPR
jgi:hypothetical protein